MIPTVSWVADLGEVPVENGSQARYVIDRDGHEWVSKGGDAVGWNDIFAEAVSWLLGRRLGVRTPDAATHVDQNGRVYWLSKRLRYYRHWSKLDGENVMNMDELGRVLVLDALVAECDRHAGNLLLEPAPDEHALIAWAIDSGNALIGQPADFIVLGNAPPDPKNHARGLPVDALADSAAAAAVVAEALAEAEVAAMVQEAAALVSEPHWRAIVDVLLNRCRRARTLVPEYLDLLRAIT